VNELASQAIRIFIPASKHSESGQGRPGAYADFFQFVKIDPS
jgi:hypothetical protein